ncbi:MAG TPA: sulfotransferase domain-containing protein [Ignavibacteria bacterium]|nr:sulfotransferase domain-containing protein [Ignavibacteria bacterium]HRB00564.1 sulfotransferase domain-containing protein [Ignavibacteria bacterium]
MLVISSGMQKSGTAYFYNVLNDLLIESGAENVRKIKDEFSLGNILKDNNNNIDGISWKDLLKISVVSFKKGTFAVKTHYPNRRSFGILSNAGFLKIIYSYRDPRDVILSVIDHGKKLKESGETGSFTKMIELDDAVRNVKSWINDCKELSKKNNILKYSYEDFIKDPENILSKVSEFLKIEFSTKSVQEVLLRYNSSNPDMPKGRLHFNKGIVDRFKTEMSISDQNRVIETLGNEIVEMGYKL